MFNIDPRVRERLAPLIQRVMVIDFHPASVRLTAELMKEIGGRQVLTIQRGDRALPVAEAFDPQLILTEFLGPEFDGLEFTRQLRRSTFRARQAGVIMITAEATAASILGARNAGVHEFLRKPFTAGDLFRRVENVALKPRQWIQAVSYVGPDRRRFNAGEFNGAEKRRGESAVA